MSIVLQSTGGGSITINEPATASNFTQTLPAADGITMVSGNMPAFSAFITGNQNLTASTITKLTFNTEAFDTNNNFDSTTNYRFTPTVAGYYQINVTLLFSDAAINSTVLQGYIYKNGTSYASLRNLSVAGNYMCITLSCVVSMNGSTDYLEIYAQSLANNGLVYGSVNSIFSGCMVRAA
jgi:hypothetical protein